jgi:hypothetical protein
MATNFVSKRFQLDDRSQLRITGDNGMWLKCERGAFWFTQEGSLRDRVIERGETIFIERSGNIVLTAIGRCRLCLGTPQPIAAPRASAVRRLSSAVLAVLKQVPHAGGAQVSCNG